MRVGRNSANVKQDPAGNQWELEKVDSSLVREFMEIDETHWVIDENYGRRGRRGRISCTGRRVRWWSSPRPKLDELRAKIKFRR